MIKILCLVLQSTAWIIAVFHSITSLSVRRNRSALLLYCTLAGYAKDFKLDIQLSDNVFQFVCAGLKFCDLVVCQMQRYLALNSVRSYEAENAQTYILESVLAVHHR